MSMRDCYRAAEKYLYRYRKIKAQVETYEEESAYKADTMGGEGVKTSGKSDPTAKGGIRLAEPPEEIATLQDWVWAIETAWADLTHYEPQKARLFEVYYGLDSMTGRPRGKAGYTRDAIMHELHISEKTFYNWRNEAVEAVIYAAIQKGALKPY